MFQRLQTKIKNLEVQVEKLKIQNEKLRARNEILSNRIPAPVDTLEHNGVNSMDKFYSQEESIAKYHAPLQQSVYEMFLDALDDMKLAKNAKVLDAGCGLGIFTNMVREHWAQNVSGFDFSEVAVKKAQAKYKKIKFFVHNIYENLGDTYDVIICTETLEHLANPDKAVKNLILALKDGGSLFLTVPDGRIDYSSKHINFWSPESWTLYIKKIGKGCGVVSGAIQCPTKAALRYNWAILTKSHAL